MPFKILVLTVLLTLFCSQLSFAEGSNGIPAGLDAGAILSAQMRNWTFQQQLFFLNGPVTSEDLNPQDPVIIDETGLLSKHKEVHGAISEPVK